MPVSSRPNKAESPRNDLLRSGVSDHDSAQSLSPSDHPGGRKVRTLLLTGVLMAVTMFSFEALKQTVLPHVSLWQSHCITIGFSTITAVIVAYILLRLNQIRDTQLAHEISQRRLIETARRESEEALRKHLELQDHVTKVTATVPGMIYSFRLRPDGATSMPYASPAVESLFALDPQAVRENAGILVSRLHKDDAARFQKSIAASAAGMTLWREEFRILHPHNGERWMEGHSVPHAEPDGSVLWHGFFQDITERKHIEEQLRKLSCAVEQSPASIVITDTRGDIEYVNPGFTTLTGYASEEVVGRNPRVLKSGGVPPEVYTGLWKTITAGHEWTGELHNKKKNGELYWESATISPIFDAARAITHFLAVKEDITNRKRAEQAMRESEARFRTICETSPIAIFLMDAHSNVVYSNPSANRITGRSAEEINGQSWREIIHPEDREQSAADWTKIKQTGEPLHTTRRYLDKNGKVVWVSATIAPIRDQDTLRGYIGLSEDITERKRVDEQLLRSQRMESLGTLASGIAHDLNNILAPILMAAPLLRKEARPDDAELLNSIEKSAQRGADIVKQVLAFARGIEGDRISLQPRHLIKEVELMMRETFPKSIVIQNRTPNDLWPIIGDSTQIHQILLNLCINARDAMPDGGKLTLSAENLSIRQGGAAMLGDVKPGNYVLMTVADSGTGIPSAIIDKIFDPFFTTKETGKGTGLGLSTVIGIVKSHGGFLKVYSEAGKGSSFKIYLPAHPDKSADSQGKAAPGLSPGNGEWILVVDDEPAVRVVTESMLRDNGYNVLTAGDGADALSVFSTHADKIKVILTDMAMPRLNGIALIKNLKQTAFPVQIIACTGQAEDTYRPQLADLGIGVVLQKPYVSEKLLASLRQMLRREERAPVIPEPVRTASI